MTASTLLSLNFNEQSIVDNTGQWEVLNDGSDVLKFALAGGSANYSLVVDHFAYKSPAVLGIINPTDYATEYTIDFDMYVQRTFGTCSWVMGFKNASATDATILIYLTEGEQVSGSIYKYNVCFQRRTNSYVSSWDDYAQTSDKPVRSGEWTKVRIKALKNTDTGYYEFEIYVNGVLKASNTTTYPITTTLENQLTIGGPSGTAYLLCDASVTPAQCSSDTGCAIDNLIITRGEAPLRPSLVSLAGLQRNNANLLSYVHSKLATVATSGSYNDLSNKPTIPVIDSALSSTSENGLQNKVIKTALDGKADSSHTHSASDITSGLATVATSGSYNDLSNKPAIPTYSAGTNLSLSDTTFNVSSTPSFTSITVSGYTITID